MDRKALIRQYKETPRPMGVFRVHNTVADKSFVGTSRDRGYNGERPRPPGEGRRGSGRWALAPLVLVASASASLGQPGGRPPSELLGTWRGTSTCTDRVAAPACHDEVVLYEFVAGAKPGTVHWKADKIVQGRREPMYETDLAYDAGEACWRAEFSSPRSPSVRGAWCLAVDGTHLTGTGLLLPGGQKFRKIDAQKDRGGAP